MVESDRLESGYPGKPGSWVRIPPSPAFALASFSWAGQLVNWLILRAKESESCPAVVRRCLLAMAERRRTVATKMNLLSETSIETLKIQIDGGVTCITFTFLDR